MRFKAYPVRIRNLQSPSLFDILGAIGVRIGFSHLNTSFLPTSGRLPKDHRTVRLTDGSKMVHRST